LLIERLHQGLERAACRQPVAIMADGVLIRHRTAQIEAEEAHPAQPIADHELHARIGQIMLRLNHQHLEHRHRVEGWAAAAGAVTIAETLDQKRPETLKLHRPCSAAPAAPPAKTDYVDASNLSSQCPE
jgi:hypothetical protein